MSREIRIVSHPDELDPNWDTLADWYYQKREFLALLHLHNFCGQRYYELFVDGTLGAGTIVYPFKTNILTFSRFNLFVPTTIIGLPISIATVPIIGDPACYERLLEEILQREHGILLGLNFKDRYLQDKVVNLRTLPTMVINRPFRDFGDYLEELRYHYRRRILLLQEKFQDVRTETTGCSAFHEIHYQQYLDVLERSTTKLETLGISLFQNLPSNFRLTTHYRDDTMLAWNICMHDRNTVFFFMSGINYSLRDPYKSYHNNLCSVIRYACAEQCDRMDLGQTAETAKKHVGGTEEERIMFLYHKNALLRIVFRLLKKLFEYTVILKEYHVFRQAPYNVNPGS